jgi:hypothetical protein
MENKAWYVTVIAAASTASTTGYALLSTITKSIEIQQAVTLVLP